MMQLLVSSEFYIKNIYLFGFSEFLSIWLILKLFFFMLIKSDKQVNTTNPFINGLC